MPESEEERIERHAWLAREDTKRQRREDDIREQVRQEGREVEVGSGRWLQAEEMSRDDVSNLPGFIQITSPVNEQQVSGRFAIWYNYNIDAGAVTFILQVNGVEIRTRNVSADSYVRSRGNRFFVNSADYREMKLQLFMTCADNRVYASEMVVVNETV